MNNDSKCLLLTLFQLQNGHRKLSEFTDIGGWKTVYFNADGTYDMNKIEQMSKEFVRLHSDRYLNVYTLARELRSLFNFFRKKY